MSDRPDSSVMDDRTYGSPHVARHAGGLRRAPVRVWLATGPAGRLVGFVIDFARALRIHLAAKRHH